MVNHSVRALLHLFRVFVFLITGTHFGRNRALYLLDILRVKEATPLILYACGALTLVILSLLWVTIVTCFFFLIRKEPEYSQASSIFANWQPLTCQLRQCTINPMQSHAQLNAMIKAIKPAQPFSAALLYTVSDEPLVFMCQLI